MRPFLADAAYVNYLGEVDEEGIRASYGKKYERVAALKAKYDLRSDEFLLPEPKHRAESRSAGRNQCLTSVVRCFDIRMVPNTDPPLLNSPV